MLDAVGTPTGVPITFDPSFTTRLVNWLLAIIVLPAPDGKPTTMLLTVRPSADPACIENEPILTPCVFGALLDVENPAVAPKATLFPIDKVCPPTTIAAETG